MPKFRTLNMYRALQIDLDDLLDLSEEWYAEEERWLSIAERTLDADTNNYAERMAAGCQVQQQFIGRRVMGE